MLCGFANVNGASFFKEQHFALAPPCEDNPNIGLSNLGESRVINSNLLCLNRSEILLPMLPLLREAGPYSSL